MYEALKRNRDALEHLILALVLPFVAGAINASGFFAVGSYTSHVTGNVARVGDELAQGHLRLALRYGGFAAAFTAGAMAATAMVLWARGRGEPRYFRGLLLEAVLLAVFASLNFSAEKPRHFFNDFVLTSLLCFAMGLQNAMVTKLSGARIRTTHLTGLTTDIGIECVRVLHRCRGAGRWYEVAGSVRKIWDEEDFVRLRLHGSIWLSFLVGAVAGPLGYIRIGHFALLIPCAILVSLAIYDLVLGLRESPAALAASASS